MTKGIALYALCAALRSLIIPPQARAASSWEDQELTVVNTVEANDGNGQSYWPHRHVQSHARDLAALALSEMKLFHQQRTLQTHSSDGSSNSTNDATATSGMDRMCSRIEAQFYEPVHCDCVGALLSSTFSVTCLYQNSICGPLDAVCGRPEIALTLTQAGVFSATTCLHDYINQQRNRTYADTCVSVELCDPTNLDAGLCGCSASYNNKVCQSCEVCDNGRGLELDCTNINAEAISQQCQNLDVDHDVPGGAGIVAGFLPDFAGFCSRLEDQAQQRVTCDCHDAGGGTYNVTCASVAGSSICAGRMCGTVTATVQVQDGKMQQVQACADFGAPLDFAETCTTMQLCDDKTSDKEICGCRATYEGKPCLCAVCEDGKSLQVNCSAYHEFAVVEQCQAVSAKSSYEFIPQYSVAVTPAQSSALPMSLFAISCMLAGVLLLSMLGS